MKGKVTRPYQPDERKPTSEIEYIERDQQQYRQIAEHGTDQPSDLIVSSTSGTTSEGGTPIPYPGRYQRISADRTAQVLDLMGLRADDVVLNLGSELPHISGQVFTRGSEALGAEVVGTGYQWIERGDYVECMDLFEDVTAVISVPSVAESIGSHLAEEENDDPRELFPNLSKGFFGGEALWPDVRAAIKNQWGIDFAGEFYANTEVNVVAGAPDESRELIPLSDQYGVEIVPEDGEHPRNVADLDETIEGDLVLSDPEREAIAVERYLPGDRIRVVPGEPNRIEVLGRESHSVNVRGVVMHEEALVDAVLQTSGGETSTVRAGKDRIDGKDFFDVYIPPEIDEELFLEKVMTSAPALRDADRLDVIDEIRIKSIEEFEVERNPAGGMKTKRMFDWT